MITKKERDSAKWIRAFEELDDDELLLARDICDRIVSLRQGDKRKWYVIPPTPRCKFCENYDFEKSRIKDRLKCSLDCNSYIKQAIAFVQAWNNKEFFRNIIYCKEK